MSIGGLMRTSVSGMNAQANRLSAVAENIANSNTNGYKQSTTEFTSQLLASSVNQYNSGAVEANIRTQIGEQGGLTGTANSGANGVSQIDLAVQGAGFLVVNEKTDGIGSNYLTRAGAFTRQSDGTMVNAGGYTLMGYPVAGQKADTVLNGFTGLVPVNFSSGLLSATPSTEGMMQVNLDLSATKVDRAAATTPGETTGTTVATTVTAQNKQSIVVYNSAGTAVTLDVYYTKVGDNKWEVAVFDQSKRNSSVTAFPYAGGPLKTADLDFSATAHTVPAGTNIVIPVPGGADVKFDLSTFTNYDKAFGSEDFNVNGNPAEVVSKVSIDDTGMIAATFSSGSTRNLFQIPMAKVAAPNNMTQRAGNVFDPGIEAGTVLMGIGGEGTSFGTITAGALENSTVDLASELTTMIESQRSYTANSKVFQTGSEIMDVLVNLKR